MHSGTDPCPEVGGASFRVQAADYVGKWVLLFFYPKDFTFVCPTEIIAFSDAAESFRARNCEVVGASTDSAEVHLAWIRTPRRRGGLGHMQIPLLADVDRRVSRAYGVLGDGNFPYRGMFLMDPKVRRSTSSRASADLTCAAYPSHANPVCKPCAQPLFVKGRSSVGAAP